MTRFRGFKRIWKTCGALEAGARCRRVAAVAPRPHHIPWRTRNGRDIQYTEPSCAHVANSCMAILATSGSADRALTSPAHLSACSHLGS
eukprot:2021251-Prymnesium_polylepis.3